jgi:biotin synthase
MTDAARSVFAAIDPQVAAILAAAWDGAAPGFKECACLLAQPATSLEASYLRAAADALTRRRFANRGLIFAQIGIEIAPCVGSCKFCSFAEKTTSLAPRVMRDEELLRAVAAFTATGELDALFLMTMHTFDFERLLHRVSLVRTAISPPVQLIVNIGDFDSDQARELKAAGVDGAYHVLRLREGSDTALDPKRRLATIVATKEASLDWWYCCEPIGPEHSPQELAEQLLLGVHYECVGHAAMRRVSLPSSPLADRGQISEVRLAQVTAVVALASLACPQTRAIGVHEPNLIGLTSGANSLFAEAGANPRDTQQETSRGRGRDVVACRTMLSEAGFDMIAPL